MKFVIALWTSCELVFMSPWDYRVQVSNAHPLPPCLSSTHAGYAKIWRGKGQAWRTLGKTWYRLGKLCPCLLTS